MVISLILMVIMSLKLLSSPSSVQGISLAMDMTQRLRLVRNSTMVDVKVIILRYNWQTNLHIFFNYLNFRSSL